MRWRKGLDVALPCALYVAFELASRFLLGLRMIVPWNLPQLLDPGHLATHPWQSLLLLHGQPPLFNTVLALAVRCQELAGVRVGTVLSALFFALGLASANVLYRALRDRTTSRVIAAAGLVGLLSDPAFHWYRHYGFYPFLLCCLFAWLLWSAIRYMREGAFAWLLGCATCLVLLTLTRALYHPLWSIGTLVLLMVLRGARGGPFTAALCRRNVLVLTVAAVVLLAWPAKNALVFGQFTYSSWRGWHLINATEAAGAEDLLGFWFHGSYPEDRVAAFPFPDWIDATGRDLLTRARKSWPWPEEEKPAKWREKVEVPNSNHVCFLIENRELTRRALRWRLEHPGRWLADARRFTMHYTHPCHVDPYGAGPAYDWHFLGEESPRFLAYSSAYRRVLHFDVHPLVERVLPGVWRIDGLDPRSPIVASLPLYGAVVLPVILVGAAACARRRGPRRSWRSAVFVLCLTAMLWNFSLSVLTDGWEAMRFRFDTLPLAWATLCMLAAGLRLRWVRVRAG